MRKWEVKYAGNYSQEGWITHFSLFQETIYADSVKISGKTSLTAPSAAKGNLILYQHHEVEGEKGIFRKKKVKKIVKEEIGFIRDVIEYRLIEN